MSQMETGDRIPQMKLMGANWTSPEAQMAMMSLVHKLMFHRC